MKLARTKEWRESRGLTQRELAAEAGVGEVTIARIETGASVTPPTARKVSEALGISVADLLERPPVPLDEAPWAPHITAEDIERQAHGGVGYGKLAIWRSQVEGFTRDRREELRTGIVTRKGGWVLPTEEGALPTWQEPETVDLEPPAVRAAWADIVRQTQGRMLDEMKDYGVRWLLDNLLAKDPRHLSGEELENYREAVGLSVALLDMNDVVLEVERETERANSGAQIDEAQREARKQELSRLISVPAA